MRHLGLDDPREAFESVVTALQGELLDEEYKCLSSGFRERNGLNEQAYRAFRDRILDESPFLRWGLSRSRVLEVVRLDERHALLRAVIPVPFRADPELRVALVREDFLDVFLDGRPLDLRAQSGPPEEFDLVRDRYVLLPASEQGRRLFVRADLTRPLTDDDLDQALEIRAGSEWRIDDYALR